MVFSSPRFLLFLIIVLICLAPSYTLGRKKIVLTIGSCLFYAAWDYRYLALLVLVSVVDYYCAARIDRLEDERGRKIWLFASVVSNLLILGYFKYYNFFTDNLNGILAQFNIHIAAGHIMLPAGISFYTFKSMSYTIDVYRREIVPCKSQQDYTTFVTFFPELIAGPIVRASVFLPQMERPIGPTADRLARGASLFLLGLTKKLVIADNLARIADPIFARPEIYGSVSVWFGLLAYAIEIYCDFSGYSDMAMGVAKMIGYDLPENFNMPYLATNITDFWRRWHITLSTWLRDYLYIPLGGNRKGRVRTYINLFITMLLGGLWHGASWNFVLWGALHGTALGLHKFFKEHSRRTLPVPLSSLLTFLFVIICWVPFRAASFELTWTILVKLCFADNTGARYFPTTFFWCALVVIAGHIIGAMVNSSLGHRTRLVRLRTRLAAFGAQLVVEPVTHWYIKLGFQRPLGAFIVTEWVLLLFYFCSTGARPFIYFQF